MLTVGSLCSGYEGLGLGLVQVLDTETAWVSEVDPSACAILAGRYPGVPNLGDLTVLDWSQVEPVDVLTAGYPCQPFSTAGRRQGANDARHLWPFIADAVGVLRPRLVVLENVAGHLSLGFDSVLADLARLGYDARWTVVRASDVGACHRRARLFIVATDSDQPSGEARSGRQGRGVAGRLQPLVSSVAPAPDAERSGWAGRPRAEGRGAGRRVAAGGAGEGRDAPAYAEDFGRQRDGRARDGRAGPADERGDAIAHAVGTRRKGQAGPGLQHGEPDWGAYGPAIARHAAAIGRPAPHPVDGRGRLNPVFVEWMMMLPAGWVTDIVTNRSKALKALGNGVVPPQAAFALRRLLSTVSEAAA